MVTAGKHIHLQLWGTGLQRESDPFEKLDFDLGFQAVLWVNLPAGSSGLRSCWEVTDRQEADGLCFDLTQGRSHRQVGTEKGGGFSPVTPWRSPVRRGLGRRRGSGTEGLCGGPPAPHDTLAHQLCKGQAAGIYYSS